MKLTPPKSYRRTVLPPLYLIVETNMIHCPEGKVETEVTRLLKTHNVTPVAFPGHSFELNPAEIIFRRIKYVTRNTVK